MVRRIGIIGGSVEAWHLAQARLDALVLMPTCERVARDWPGDVHQGPLTPDALQGLTAVVEAAHPCDQHTAWHAARLAQAAGLPHLQLVRPEWRATRQDRWRHLRSLAEARGLPESARVLITLGRAELSGLRGWRGQALVRRIGLAEEPCALLRAHFLNGQGPFSVQSEIDLLRKNRIDWLLLRNAGGAGGWPKLAAARALRLPVAMVARPKRPLGPRVRQVEEALAWLDRQNV